MSGLRRTVNRVLPRVHAKILRWSGGRIGAHIGAARICLLTTTGRRSGKPRTIPLNTYTDGDRVVLIASNDGQDHHPDWFYNLVATPAATISFDHNVLHRRGRLATEDERADLWPKITTWYPAYARYQSRTKRTIPLFIFDPG